MKHPTPQATPGHQAISGTSGPTVFVMVDNEKKETSFAKKSATGLSIVQIILGIASFLAQTVIIILLSANDDNAGGIDYAGGIGEGIYCGIFFIITGSLGILASRKPSICCIIAFMTLSIIASIFSGIQIILASIKLGCGRGGGDDCGRHVCCHVEHHGSGRGGGDDCGHHLCCHLLRGLLLLREWIKCRQGGLSSSGAVTVQMAGGVPVQMGNGVPVQMAYLPQATPVTGVLDQTLNNLPSYEDVVRGDEQETKEQDQGSKAPSAPSFHQLN